jgi:hypothetical protein
MISRAHPFLVLVALAMAASPVVVGILQLFRDRPEPEVVVTPQETTKDLERISNFFTVDRSRSVEVKPPPRFSFEFDSKTSLSELLPQPPKVASERPSPLNEDLARVPELAFGDPLARNLAKEKAMEKTAHVIAKINRVNED